MARSALRRPLAAALLVGLALTPAALAGPTVARWAAPVGGSFSTASNWENGVAPSETVGAIIDATGSPYSVVWSAPPTTLRSILVDSLDARFTVFTQSSSAFSVLETLEVRRGTSAFQGRLAGGSVRIGSEATLNILNESSPPSYRGAVLSLIVVNEGLVSVAGNAIVTQGQGGLGPIPGGRSITNSATGVMRFEGGNLFIIGTLNNYGLVEVVNNPEYDGPSNTIFDIDDLEATAIGATQGFIDAPAVFNNHGVTRVHQRGLQLEGQGEHSGRFELLSDSATLVFAGDHTFEPGAEVIGSGTTRFAALNTVSGSLRVEGDLVLGPPSFGADEPSTDMILDVGGTLTADSMGSLEFLAPVRAGVVLGDQLGTLIFRDAADVGIAPGIRTLEFHGPAAVRGDLTMPSTGSARFFDGASIEGDWVGGTGIGTGHITVGGDLRASEGNWLLSAQQDAAPPTRLAIAGDVDITTPFTMQGELIAGGAFSAIGGRFESVTAATVRFGSTDPSAAAITIIETGSTITSRNGRTLIENSLIRLDPNGGAFSAEEVVFASGLEIIAPIAGGLAVAVNPSTNNATTFTVNADSTLSGTLAVGVFGDPSQLSFGDSFTILEGRVPFGSTDPLPTITGEFDRLFLPSLSDELFFDVVYEPSAVRLVVVPAPGAITTLAGVGALAFRRRTRR